MRVPRRHRVTNATISRGMRRLVEVRLLRLGIIVLLAGNIPERSGV